MRRSSAQCLCDCRAFKRQWTTFGASGVSGRTNRTRSTAAIGRSVAVALVRSLRIRNVSVQHLARLLGAPNFRSRLKIDLWRRFDATLALGVVNQLVGVESRGKLSAGGTERAGGRDRGADFVGPVHPGASHWRRRPGMEELRSDRATPNPLRTFPSNRGRPTPLNQRISAHQVTLEGKPRASTVARDILSPPRSSGGGPSRVPPLTSEGRRCRIRAGLQAQSEFRRWTLRDAAIACRPGTGSD